MLYCKVYCYTETLVSCSDPYPFWFAVNKLFFFIFGIFTGKLCSIGSHTDADIHNIYRSPLQQVRKYKPLHQGALTAAYHPPLRPAGNPSTVRR